MEIVRSKSIPLAKLFAREAWVNMRDHEKIGLLAGSTKDEIVSFLQWLDIGLDGVQMNLLATLYSR